MEIWDTASTEMGAFVRVFVPDLQQYPDIPYVTYHTLKFKFGMLPPFPITIYLSSNYEVNKRTVDFCILFEP